MTSPMVSSKGGGNRQSAGRDQKALRGAEMTEQAKQTGRPVKEIDLFLQSQGDSNGSPTPT